MSDSHATAAGPAGFGGAACSAGLAAAGFGGTPGSLFAAGSPGFFAGTDSTEGGVGAPAGPLGSPVEGGGGDLVSSGIAATAQTLSLAELKENVNF